MISICVPVTLVISYSLIIPPACHLFNRKQINCLFLYIAKALMLRTAQSSHELGRSGDTECYCKDLIKYHSSTSGPCPGSHPLVLPEPRDKSTQPQRKYMTQTDFSRGNNRELRERSLLLSQSSRAASQLRAAALLHCLTQNDLFWLLF